MIPSQFPSHVLALAALVLLAAASLSDAFSPALLVPPSSSSLPALSSLQPQPRYVGYSRIRPLYALDDDDDEDDDDEVTDADAASPDDYIVNVGDLEGDDADTDGIVGTEDDGQPPAWAASAERIQELRMQHRRHDKDTGSPEFQVAGMTERIRYLTGHLQQHPTDYSTRRGLVALVNKRRRLLNYLSREDLGRYQSLIASLGIRHKAPGRVPDRVEKYSRFPTQKAVKKHLIN